MKNHKHPEVQLEDLPTLIFLSKPGFEPTRLGPEWLKVSEHQFLGHAWASLHSRSAEGPPHMKVQHEHDVSFYKKYI